MFCSKVIEICWKVHTIKCNCSIFFLLFFEKGGNCFLLSSNFSKIWKFVFLVPLKSKNILENKELAVISSKFRHLIWQSNEKVHDNSKFLCNGSYNGIASWCSVAKNVNIPEVTLTLYIYLDVMMYIIIEHYNNIFSSYHSYYHIPKL